MTPQAGEEQLVLHPSMPPPPRRLNGPLPKLSHKIPAHDVLDQKEYSDAQYWAGDLPKVPVRVFNAGKVFKVHSKVSREE